MQPLESVSPAPRPVDGTLLLPDVRKRRIRVLLKEYFERCRDNRVFEVTITHGKQNHIYKRTVESVLKEMPEVACFRSRYSAETGFTSTVAVLLRPDEYPLTPILHHPDLLPAT